jgi:hypothetical protein
VNKRKINIYTTIIISSLIVGFLFYHYFINIYEVTISAEPKALYADNQSEVVISVVPLNSFGWRALFRTASAEFEIIEGLPLVEIIKIDRVNGKMILKARSEKGKVIIEIKSPFSLLPTIIEIPVYPNYG